jgi:uncharacterized membrane protein
MTLRGGWAIGVLVALAVSLAVNFTLGGFVSARMFLPHPPPRSGGFSTFMTAADRAFPEEMREALRDDLFNNPSVKTHFEALRADRKKMFEVMRAEPFDPAALKTVLDDIQVNTSALQQAGHVALERIVAETPPEVRAEIGKRRYGHDRHGPPDDGPPPPRD